MKKDVTNMAEINRFVFNLILCVPVFWQVTGKGKN
jgi:hypothetical protein